MDFGVVAFLLAIIIVGVLVFVAILVTGRREHHLNQEVYQTRFLKIENKLQKNNPATYALTVIDADKLLDRALTELGVPGQTMGDKLKKAPSRFSDVNAVWRAHKLRNALAHEPDAEIGYKQAATALMIYRKALKDLGAI